MTELPTILLEDLVHAVELDAALRAANVPRTNIFGTPVRSFFYGYLYPDGRRGHGSSHSGFPADMTADVEVNDAGVE